MQTEPLIPDFVRGRFPFGLDSDGQVGTEYRKSCVEGGGQGKHYSRLGEARKSCDLKEDMVPVQGAVVTKQDKWSKRAVNTKLGENVRAQNGRISFLIIFVLGKQQLLLTMVLC